MTRSKKGPKESRGPRRPADAGTTLLACILSSSLVGVDSMMATVALPSLAEELDAGLVVQQWVMGGFLLAVGSLLVLGGVLGDLYDRWAVFVTGTVGFGVAALVSAVAPNAGVLIAGRLMQGVAAALMLPSALAVITNTFTGEARSRAIGTWTAWSGLSVIVAPFVGGLIVDAWSWRWTFVVVASLTIVVVSLIIRAAPGFAFRTQTGESVDWFGASLGVLLAGGPVLAIIQGPELGWDHPLVVGSIALGVISGGSFIWWERRTPNPILPLYLFRNRDFAILNLVTFVLYGALIASGVYTVLFLVQTGGYSPAVAGLVAAIPVGVLFLFSRIFGALADRHGSRWFIGGGSIVVAGGVLLLLRVDADAALVGVVLPSVLIHGLGLAMLVAPLTAGVLSAVNPDHSGLASGVNNAVARIGSLLGIAVIGLVISFQFSARIEGSLIRNQLSEAGHRAVLQAEDRSLVTTPANGLESPEHELVREILIDSSVSAFRAGMATIAGLAMLAGLTCLLGLRHGHGTHKAARVPGGALHGAHQDLT